MNNLLKQLRPCPFCNSNHEDHWTWISQLDEIGNWALFHHCQLKKEGLDVTISIYGNSPEAVVERWNTDGKEHPAE